MVWVVAYSYWDRTVMMEQYATHYAIEDAWDVDRCLKCSVSKKELLKQLERLHNSDTCSAVRINKNFVVRKVKL